MSQAAAAARDDRSAGAMDANATPMTAEGVAAALKAGTLDLRTEEWRRRLLAAGLEEEDVQSLAAAVDDSREAYDSAFWGFLWIQAAAALFLGVLYIICGALVPGLDVHGWVVRVAGGASLVFVGAFVVWVAQSQRRLDKEVQEQVLPILQLSLQHPPV